MKCTHCNGKGKVKCISLPYDDDEMVCQFCGGTGKVEKTNEEWLDNLPTEEKAEVIFDIVEFCLNYETYPDKNKYKDLMGTVEDIKRWLRQPHKNEK